MGIKKWMTKQIIKGALALIRAGFNLMDKDKNGEISYAEFEQAAEELHIYSSELAFKVFGK